MSNHTEEQGPPMSLDDFKARNKGWPTKHWRWIALSGGGSGLILGVAVWSVASLLQWEMLTGWDAVAIGAGGLFVGLHGAIRRARRFG